MHEPTSGRHQIVVVSTAAVGLLLVAMLALMMTPGSAPSQVASPAASVLPGPVSTMATLSPGIAATAEVVDAPATIAATVMSALVSTTVATVTVLATLDTAVSSTFVSIAETSIPVELAAVPVGRDGLALMTTPDQDVTVGDVMSVRLPHGADVDALVLNTETVGIVVVSIPDGHGERYESGPPDAPELAPDDTIQVHGPTAGIVTMAALADLDVADGTPLTDAEGQLVGLCVEDADTGETTMLVIDPAVVDAIDGRD